MIEPAVVARYVADVLGRLHDRSYLEGHPLGELLAAGGKTADGDSVAAGERADHPRQEPDHLRVVVDDRGSAS